jgi:hypothetical protein
MTNKISFVHYFLLTLFIFFVLLVLIKNYNINKINNQKIEKYTNGENHFNIGAIINEYIPKSSTKKDTCEEKCGKKKNEDNLGKDALDLLKGYTSNIKDKIIKPKLNKFTHNKVNYYGVSETACYDKNDDFDNWCRFNYVPSDKNPLPDGYSVNSIGVQKILNGIDGDCNNPNLSRAICDFNSIQEVNKIEPLLLVNSDDNLQGAKYNSKYNNFTDCMPLSDSSFTNVDNFRRSCANLLKVDKSNAVPDEIMGYDCNPGYYRAKCKKIVNFR